FGEVGHVQAHVEQAGDVDQQCLDRRWILGALQVMRRLPHEAEMRHSTPLRGVQDYRGNAGRALVGRTAIDAPGFDQRPPGGVSGARCDPYRTRMRRASQERPEGDDPLHPTALGDIEERRRVGAPLLMGLRTAKQEDAVSTIFWMRRKELALLPVDVTA